MVEDEASDKLRYEGLGFHDVRRAAATGLVAEGVDVKTAQDLLGHSDSRLTLDHLRPGRDRAGRGGGQGDGPEVPPPGTAR
jgi:integrase